jgi:hypothetical protein
VRRSHASSISCGQGMSGNCRAGAGTRVSSPKERRRYAEQAFPNPSHGEQLLLGAARRAERQEGKLQPACLCLSGDGLKTEAPAAGDTAKCEPLPLLVISGPYTAGVYGVLHAVTGGWLHPTRGAGSIPSRIVSCSDVWWGEAPMMCSRGALLGVSQDLSPVRTRPGAELSDPTFCGWLLPHQGVTAH